MLRADLSKPPRPWLYSRRRAIGLPLSKKGSAEAYVVHDRAFHTTWSIRQRRVLNIGPSTLFVVLLPNVKRDGGPDPAPKK